MEERVLEGEVEAPPTLVPEKNLGDVGDFSTLPIAQLEIQWKLARLTAFGYFSLLSVPFVFLLIGKLDVNETIDLIKTMAAILSGIVGMVWGFYFYKG